MHIAIIGAGLAGLTTAYSLQKRNLSVTVFEAERLPGSMASWANGAQLSYSYTDPLAGPKLLRSLPAILCGRSPGIKVRHKADYNYLRWSAEFLWNCMPHKQRQNVAELENLAARAAELMDNYHNNDALNYYQAKAGKLVLLESAPGKSQHRAVERKRLLGIETEILNRDQALELSPELERWTTGFSHAIFARADSVADPRAFTQSLSAYLSQVGVKQCFGARVDELQPTGRGIAVTQRGETEEFDAAVVCTGNQSKELLSQTERPPRLQPITGYSLSLPAGASCPKPSITALEQRLVVARLENKVRIAGLADINAHPGQGSARLNDLLETAQALAPEVADYGSADRAEWIGHRPSTPGGPPAVGATSVAGLFQNIGHGSLGWTLCAATAEITADAVLRASNTRIQSFSSRSSS